MMYTHTFYYFFHIEVINNTGSEPGGRENPRANESFQRGIITLSTQSRKNKKETVSTFPCCWNLEPWPKDGGGEPASWNRGQGGGGCKEMLLSTLLCSSETKWKK